MKHYKDPITNEIYAYESDGSQDAIIKKGLVDVTDVEIAAIHAAKVQAFQDSLTYADLRAAAYPPIGDQLDALFRAGVFPPEMAAQLQAVKDAHPKSA